MIIADPKRNEVNYVPVQIAITEHIYNGVYTVVQ